MGTVVQTNFKSVSCICTLLFGFWQNRYGSASLCDRCSHWLNEHDGCAGIALRPQPNAGGPDGRCGYSCFAVGSWVLVLDFTSIWVRSVANFLVFKKLRKIQNTIVQYHNIGLVVYNRPSFGF